MRRWPRAVEIYFAGGGLRYIFPRSNDSEIRQTIFQHPDATRGERVSVDAAGVRADFHRQSGLVLEFRPGSNQKLHADGSVGKFHRGTAGTHCRMVWRGTFHLAPGPGPDPRGAATRGRRLESAVGIGGSRGRNRPARGKVRRHGRDAATAAKGARRGRPETAQPRDAAGRRVRRRPVRADEPRPRRDLRNIFRRRRFVAWRKCSRWNTRCSCNACRTAGCNRSPFTD